MKNWGRICIGTRLEKQVDSQFLEVWSHFISKGMQKGDGYLIIRDRVAHVAANDLVRRFLQTDADTLFMLDSDADIGPNFLNEFRDYEAGWEYDILQAFYPRRGWPPKAIWFKESVLGDSYEAAVFGEDIIEDVAIVGTHAVLIRREVFVKMLGDNDPANFDWFFYPRHVKASEDGAFSSEAKKLGFRLGATTHVKAGHISRVTTGWETYQEYLELSGTNAFLNKYHEVMHLIAEFTGEAASMVQAKVLKGSKGLSEFHAKDPEAARAFYGQADNGYLYDLLAWNCSEPYLEITRPLHEISGKQILIVGPGIGGEADILADQNIVDCFELPGVLKDFGTKRLGNRVTYLDGQTVTEAVHAQYDLVVMIDVVEHIHPDEFDITMDWLAIHSKEFYIHVNFGQQNVYPMHYNNAALFENWLARHNLEKRGTYAFIRGE